MQVFFIIFIKNKIATLIYKMATFTNYIKKRVLQIYHSYILVY
nr:MAG TPA: hypothetical protein [Caudoviricetes sp.]